MDALAIIQALDYIKNEEVYRERLKNIQEAEERLEGIREICSTVEDAKEQLKRSHELTSTAQAEAKKITETADEYYKDKQLEIEKRLKEIAVRETALKEYDQVLKDQQAKVRVDGLQNVKLKEELEAFKNETQKKVQEAYDTRALYSKKLDELKRIVNA